MPIHVHITGVSRRGMYVPWEGGERGEPAQSGREKEIWKKKADKTEFFAEDW